MTWSCPKDAVFYLSSYVHFVQISKKNITPSVSEVKGNIVLIFFLLDFLAKNINNVCRFFWTGVRVKHILFILSGPLSHL